MPDTIVNPASSLRVVDFHNHFVGPSVPLTTLANVPPAMYAFWEGVNHHLENVDALMDSLDANGIAARVISAPLEFLQDADGNVPIDSIMRVNDAVAALVNRYPGQLYGLATIDAYSGAVGARELTRAVKELGLRGAFIESAKGDLLPDADQARPTFTAAAELGVPLLLHPVPDRQLSQRFRPYGRTGGRLVRGTINAAALVALLESGMLDEMPNLRVVVTSLALGGVLLAGAFGDGARLRKDTPADARRHVYIDTTGLHPVMIRSAVDLLGADHVLTGTDWPVVVEKSVSERMQAMLAACGLDAAEQQLVAGSNALRLLGVG